MDANDRKIAASLIDLAVGQTDHPAKAVSLLFSAGATILQRHFGEEGALSLVTQAVDEAAAQLRAHQVH